VCCVCLPVRARASGVLCRVTLTSTAVNSVDGREAQDRRRAAQALGTTRAAAATVTVAVAVTVSRRSLCDASWGFSSLTFRVRLTTRDRDRVDAVYVYTWVCVCVRSQVDRERLREELKSMRAMLSSAPSRRRDVSGVKPSVKRELESAEEQSRALTARLEKLLTAL
jgi:hypothetical protein